MSYLGLDIGTTGCKAVAFSDAGVEISRAYIEYGLLSPAPGYAELDADAVASSCLSVIKQAASASGRDPVNALSISSQGEAFVPVDGSNMPLMNAMVSSDSRARTVMENYLLHFSADDLYRKTGHTAHPMFSLFKLAWLREHEPELMSRAAHFYCFEDFIHTKLGITPAIGFPLAARTMLFNSSTCAWDASILDSIGLTPEKLARPLPSGTVAGVIPDAIALSLNLAPGCIIAAGAHDQPCGALGVGAVDEGIAAYSAGTVECITPVFNTRVMSPALEQANLATYAHAVTGKYVSVAFSLTGGNIIKWFRDEFGERERAAAAQTKTDVYDALLAAMPDEPTSLMSLPYFTPSGTPHFDIDTPGCITGLRLSTHRGEILKCLIEGVGYEMRHNLDLLAAAGVAVTELRMTGGGSKNRRLVQLKADILGCPVYRMGMSEGGARGAAILAMSAHTGGNIRAISKSWILPGEHIEPRRKASDRYAERMAEYRSLYTMMKTLSACR
ncbi:MAG: hypothetical protein HZC28_18440 [Spirochaetes bacterium]|nr:hypothetical protein [Spirochaetota bacterium]